MPGRGYVDFHGSRRDAENVGFWNMATSYPLARHRLLMVQISPLRNSANFALTEFSEVRVPGSGLTPSLPLGEPPVELGEGRVGQAVSQH